MSAQAVWIIAALVVLGAEMLLGTLYLLAVFLGCLGATVCAYLDCSVAVQGLTAGLITVAGTVGALIFRKKLRTLNRNPDPDSNDLDKGQRVRVEEITSEGLGKVSYRGSVWTAEGQDGPLRAGTYLIVKVRGPRLILGERISD